jgi:hypothetical protein
LVNLIERAGLAPWPRLFHNLRSSRETELLEQFPVHVVALWMGHDAKVCLKHYAQTTDQHFDRAASRAERGSPGSQNAARCVAVANRGESSKVSANDDGVAVCATPRVLPHHNEHLQDGEGGKRVRPQRKSLLLASLRHNVFLGQKKRLHGKRSEFIGDHSRKSEIGA